MYEFKSIEARYLRVWPALVTILFWRWTRACFVNTARGGRGWERKLTGGLAGFIPALVLAFGYVLVLVGGICYWPLGFFQMLPVRIGVKRHAPDLGSIWMLSFFAWFGITWVIGFVLAMRDHRPSLPGSPAAEAIAR
jgi:hypothetical protein